MFSPIPQGVYPRITDLDPAALARRGYQWTDISAALRRYGAEIEED